MWKKKCVKIDNRLKAKNPKIPKYPKDWELEESIFKIFLIKIP